LKEQGKIIIDGGSGEIARRRYLNRLLIFNKKAILDRNPQGIIKYLRLNKANIFSTDFIRQLEFHVEDEMIKFLDAMPPVSKNEIENWLDLMAIRSRFPNFAGIEQSRSDSEVINYMPFIQPSVLSTIFNIPVKIRKDGTLFKRIINLNYPALEKYQLVKEDISYPYFLSTFSASVLSVVKRKLERTNIDNTEHQYLSIMKDFLFDTINSTDFKNFNLYDQTKITELISDYYKGNLCLSKQVDWFISFELFRQELLIKY
jgi:hypothetical protein